MAVATPANAAKISGSIRSATGKAVGLLVLLAGGVWMLLPLLWMLSASLMPLSEVIKVPPVWFAPQKYSIGNFLEVWFEVGFWRFALNSTFIAMTVTVAQLLTSTMAGFAFARYEFPGRTAIFIVILSTLMIPLFIMMAKMGLVNTYAGLMVPALVTPFGIFLMRQFMLGIPKSLLEAARMDGAPEPFIYARIMLPLSKPAIAALTIFTFLAAWDDFLWPLIILNSKEKWTLPIAMSRFTEQYISQTHLQMAGAAVMFLPVLVIFLLMQRNFIEGVAMTGLKG